MAKTNAAPSSTPNNTPFYPPLDEKKIPPEVATHLRLFYDRVQNHYQAIGNLQGQVKALQSQVAALTKGK